MTLLTGRVGPGSGTGGVVFRVASALRDRGCDVLVRARLVDAAPHGVRVEPLIGPEAPEDGRLRVAFDRVRGAEVVRAGGGVHAAWTAVGADTPWRRARSRAPAEVAVERAEAFAYGAARRVIANSERVARELRLFHGLGPDHVRLVRTGVDLAHFAPDATRRTTARRALGARGRVAAFVGHSWRRKGLRVAIDAFRAAAGPDDALWVMGSDARESLWRWRHADPRIHFLGAVDPAPLLPGADALLSPSRYDPASNVVLEALACGVPTVVSLADGSSEVVTDRRLCVADPGRVQGFADALRLAWEDADLRALARADAERWPDSRMVDGLIGVIEECSRG